MKPNILVLFSFGLLLHGCATLVSGQIIQDTGEKLTGVEGKVNIQGLDRNNRQISEIVSIDADGQFSNQTDLKKGRYLIEALIPGYQSESQTIEIDASRELSIAVRRLTKRKTNLIDLQDQTRLDRGSGNVKLTPPEF